MTRWRERPEPRQMVGQVAFSVCICTRNRPDELRRAIRSVLDSEYAVHQVIVSDDSTDDRTRALLASEFSELCYSQGPRTGLGANRNNALAQATGTHVLFIDDDVEISPDFLGKMAARLMSADNERLILSGAEINGGERVLPHKPSFLGYQALDYAAADRLISIVINATVFPVGVFNRLGFDPNLVYGCEELDFATRAVYRHGYRVELVPDAANFHFPSPVNRDFYAPFMEASRIYVTFKKYYFLDERKLKAFIFVMVACPHNLAHNLRHGGLSGLRRCASTLGTAMGYMRRCFQDVARHV